MRVIALLISGFAIWSAAFLGIYAVQAIGCAIEVAPSLLRGTLIALTVISVLACAGVVWVALQWKGMLRLSAICAAVAALAATALTFSGVLWMQMC